jgi:hypothetical protein
MWLFEVKLFKFWLKCKLCVHRSDNFPTKNIPMTNNLPWWTLTPCICIVKYLKRNITNAYFFKPITNAYMMKVVPETARAHACMLCVLQFACIRFIIISSLAVAYYVIRLRLSITCIKKKKLIKTNCMTLFSIL